MPHAVPSMLPKLEQKGELFQDRSVVIAQHWLLGRAHIHLRLADRAPGFLDFRNLGITGLEITNSEISVFFIIRCMRRRRKFCDFDVKEHGF